MRIQNLTIALLVGITIMLSACQAKAFVVNVAAVKLSMQQLDQQVDLVEAAIEKNVTDFTQAQREQIDEVRGEFRDLRRAVRSLVDDRGDLATVLIETDQVRTLYVQARQTYREAKETIKPGLDDLSPEVKAEIAILDRRARNLEKSIKAVLSRPDKSNITGHVADAIRVGASAARLTRSVL